MSLLKKLAGETMLYGLSSILGRVLNYFILTTYLTRVFTGDDTEKYGIHGIMYGFAALLMVFFTYRMETTFFRFGSKKGQEIKTFSTASISLIVSSGFLVILIWLFAEPITTELISRPGQGRFVQYFALMLGLDTLAVLPFARLRLENKPIRFAFFKILNILVNIAVLIFFLEICPWLMANGYEWMVGGYDPEWNLDYVFIANLVASAATLLFFLPQYARMKWQFDWDLWNSMLKYAGPLVIVGVAGVISQLLDRYMLNKLLLGTTEENLQQVGIYSACVKVAILMSLFIQAFNYAAEPFFFRHADRSDSRQVYGQVAQAFSLVGSLLFLGIMLYLDLVKYLIGPDYREGLTVVPILLIAYFFLGLYYNFSIWYKLADKTSVGAYISIGGALITIVANWVLIPHMGYLGSAWAGLAAYAFMAIANYLAGRRFYAIDYPIGKMTLYLGLAIGAYFLSALLRPALEGQLALILLVNTGIFLSYLGSIAWVERPTVRRMLQRPR